MITKILVPLDGSKTGEAALPYVENLAAKLAPAGKVEVILLQVISQLVHYTVVGEEAARTPYAPDEVERIKKQALQYLTEAGAPLRLKGLETRVRVDVGNAAEEISRSADELDVDMIAISSHGRSGLGRIAFGSITDKVLHIASKPVLVVRAPKSAQD